MGSDISFTFRKIILYQQWLVETWTRREDTWTFNHHFDVYWPYLVDSENFEMINLFYLTCKPTFSSDTVFYTEPQKTIYKSSSQSTLPFNTTLSWRIYILDVVPCRPPTPAMLISSPNSGPDTIYLHSLTTVFPFYFCQIIFLPVFKLPCFLSK